MKKHAVFLLVCFLLLGLSSTVSATLITIGTAGYDSDGDGVRESYNLIWDDNNNGNSVVWLDYSNIGDSWKTHMTWVSGLNGNGILSYDIYSNYSIDWGINRWRLPNAGTNPILGTYPSGGYNVTNSELGHLYYTEFGYQSYLDTAKYVTAPELNASDFDNLSLLYWFGDNDSGNFVRSWSFDLSRGKQGHSGVDLDRFDGIAIRTGQVTYSTPVPEPSTIFLFGLGLLGLAGVSRKK